jgi:hypothetical protein
MRAISLEEISQGHRAVRRPAGMLALHCSPVVLDKAPMARYGQAKHGIRPDLEVCLSPMVTRDGRICGPVPYSAANSRQPGSRSAALSAPAGTACAVSDTHPGSEVTVLFEAGKPRAHFVSPPGLASIALECMLRSDWPDLTGLLSEGAPKSGQRDRRHHSGRLSRAGRASRRPPSGRASAKESKLPSRSSTEICDLFNIQNMSSSGRRSGIDSR